MKPTRLLIQLLAKRLAEDTDSLSKAEDQMSIVPVNADFDSSLDLTYSGLSSSFGAQPVAEGSAMLRAGSQAISYNPENAETTIHFVPVLGIYLFRKMGGADTTLYGFALIDADTEKLFATKKLPDPLTLTTTKEGFDFGPMSLTFPDSMWK